MNIDVTEQLYFENPDDECLPITKCICGKEWEFWYGLVISIYENNPKSCPNCGRKYFFRQSITIFEVVEEK